MKILIVDDEQLDLFIAKKLLGMEYEVEGFTSLTDALNWAKENSFDVLLSDYYISSDVHAQDVIREVKSTGKNFKAYVLSNHIDDRQASELKASGFHGIIDKPLTIEKFKSIIGV